jgi:hypothetical protein
MSRNTMIVLMYHRHKLENIVFCEEHSNGKNILHKDKNKCKAKRNLCVRFEVLPAVAIKHTVFCDVNPCSLVKITYILEKFPDSIFRQKTLILL